MKKLLSLLLCTVLVFATVACGSDGGADAGKNDGLSTQAPVHTDSASQSGHDETPQSGDGEGTQAEDTETPAEPWVLVKQQINSYLYTDYIYDDTGRVIEERTFNTKFSEVDPKSTCSWTYEEKEDGTVVARGLNTWIELSEYRGTELIYNAEGICMERIQYDTSKSPEDAFAEGKMASQTRYEYDEENRLVRADYLTYDEASVYVYDAAGCLIQKESWKNGECWENIKYTYNDTGDVIAEDSKNTVMGDSVQEYTCQYDYDGDILLEKSIRDDHGGQMCSTRYGYDENGRLASVIVDSAHDGLIPHTYFLGDGYMMEEICFGGQGMKAVFKPLSVALMQ